MALVCTNCGFIGIAKRVTPGTIWLELGLWVTGLLTLVFVIGLLILPCALVYSVWRIAARHYACPSCSARNMVPDISPVGRRIIEQQRGA